MIRLGTRSCRDMCTHPQAARRRRAQPPGHTLDQRKALRKARDWVAMGAAFFFGGLLVSLVTSLGASQQGGLYFLCSGAVLWGLYTMVAGSEDLHDAKRMTGPR